MIARTNRDSPPIDNTNTNNNKVTVQEVSRGKNTSNNFLAMGGGLVKKTKKQEQASSSSTSTTSSSRSRSNDCLGAAPNSSSSTTTTSSMQRVVDSITTTTSTVNALLLALQGNPSCSSASSSTRVITIHIPPPPAAEKQQTKKKDSTAARKNSKPAKKKQQHAKKQILSNQKTMTNNSCSSSSGADERICTPKSIHYPGSTVKRGTNIHKIGKTLLGERAQLFAKYLQECPGQQATFVKSCADLQIDRRRLLDVVAIFEGAGLIKILSHRTSRNGIFQWTPENIDSAGVSTTHSTSSTSSSWRNKVKLLKREEKQLDAWIQWMQGRNANITTELQRGADFGGLYVTRDDLLKQRQQQHAADSTSEIDDNSMRTAGGDMLQLILATQRGSTMTIPTPLGDATTVDGTESNHVQYSLKVSESDHSNDVFQERPIAAYIMEGENKGHKLSKLKLMPKPPLLQRCCSDFSLEELEDHTVPPQLTSTSSDSSSLLEDAKMLQEAFFGSSSSIDCRM